METETEKLLNNPAFVEAVTTIVKDLEETAMRELRAEYGITEDRLPAETAPDWVAID